MEANASDALDVNPEEKPASVTTKKSPHLSPFKTKETKPAKNSGRLRLEKN